MYYAQERYIPGSAWAGRITSVMDYGVFVEIATGVEGLMHVSNMPDGMLAALVKNTPLHVVVRSLDMERRRLDLGLPQTETV